MRADRRVAKQLAPVDQPRLEEHVPLLRIALGVRELDRPREAVGQAAPNEPVELLLERAPGGTDGLVGREGDRDAGTAGGRGGVRARVRQRPRGESIGDLLRRDQPERQRLEAGAGRLGGGRPGGGGGEKGRGGGGGPRRLLGGGPPLAGKGRGGGGGSGAA